MDAKVKQILNIAVILIVVGWILVQTGVLGPLDRIRLHCEHGSERVFVT